MGSRRLARTGLGAGLAAALFAAGAPGMASADCGASAGPGVDWTDCRKRNLILDHTDLTGAVMSGADLTSSDLRESTLDKADFSKAGMGRAMFDKSKAQGANFEKAQGYRTSFAGTDLSGANFAKSEMQRADFKGANLAGADFTKSELGRADFEKADISGADFSFSNLARADLRGATFAEPLSFAKSYMYRTRIEGVDLSGARNLEQWQVDLACGDAATKLPAGLVAGPGWPCTEE